MAGVISVLGALFIGVPLGLLAGLIGGWVDALISRVADAMLSVPFLILAIALAALLAFVSLMLMSWAYARAEAQRLVPIEYTAFLWAALVGWFAFNEPVTPATLAGTALIIFGCLIATRQQPNQIETAAD